MKFKYLAIVSVCIVLASCATSSPLVDPEYCEISSINEFAGHYKNSSVPQKTYLSEVLETVSGNYGKLEHEKITSVVLEMQSAVTARATYLSESKNVFSELLQFTPQSGSSSVRLYSSNSFLPSPSGGLTVGPQSLRVVMYKSCGGELKVMKSEAAYGLTFLIIPGGNSVQDFWAFGVLN